jgi:AraC-like DNA-binding protein
VNRRRVEYAKKRLSEQAPEDEKNISELATESGFASFPSFYRAFVKYVGESPTSWLKGLKS